MKRLLIFILFLSLTAVIIHAQDTSTPPLSVTEDIAVTEEVYTLPTTITVVIGNVAYEREIPANYEDAVALLTGLAELLTQVNNFYLQSLEAAGTSIDTSISDIMTAIDTTEVVTTITADLPVIVIPPRTLGIGGGLALSYPSGFSFSANGIVTFARLGLSPSLGFTMSLEKGMSLFAGVSVFYWLK